MADKKKSGDVVTEAQNKADEIATETAGKKKQKELTPDQRRALKEAAFKRVLPKRMNNALKAIRLVGQCSGANYVYSETQAKQILEALAVAVRQCSESYGKGVKKADNFKLE